LVQAYERIGDLLPRARAAHSIQGVSAEH